MNILRSSVYFLGFTLRSTSLNCLEEKEMAMIKKKAVWEEAKKKCKLNAETLKMAKEMGLNPRSLIKNIPNKNEQWKAPVSIWIQEIYEERQAKALKKKTLKGKKEKTEIHPEEK